ncbi:sugar ABC transporter ATP-binding protein [Horticoccus luteus]|uniref:Sugar ABC transporter ATP-binding protein n=1 Tax=Horticoccus luteus TaxID=2862869 RepID=A0A8F9TTN3_9BACT|nr:sugar ABC transporter ATP-binding protein [Horticoccus luteus]QYM77584.1 sugar ABC transporter ATP-binding protein [Horticoccus luteus]
MNTAAAAPIPRLHLAGVRKRFGATHALAGVTLSLAAGEVHALVGENGAGKSTLMKILAGVHAPDAGEMRLDGVPFRPADPLAGRRAGIVMVHQELAIAPHLSAAENIVLGAEPGHALFVPPGRVRQVAREALQQLGRTDLPLDVPAGSLSVADQQMLEIARALALGCRVLVLDEPTSSLTREDAARLFSLVRRLREQGRSVIYISHFLEEVQVISDRYTVLRDGATVGTGRTADTTAAALVRLMVGRDVNELYVRSPRTAGDAALAITGLSGRHYPRGASLSVRRGEVLGLAGLVGAGRTELLRAIFGLDSVRAGNIRVAQWSGGALTPPQAWAHGMGLVSEDRKSEGLALTLSIAENTTLASLPRFVRPAVQLAAARRWIERLAIRCHDGAQPVGELSGGNQQKVALARLLHHDVDVLLLDEPTRGIDVGAKETIYRLIDELASSGKAVLLVSSYLPELLGICDRIAVMCRGALGPALPREAWTEHAIMLAATLGTHESAA